MKDILKDAGKLLEAYEAGFGECEPYQLLRRCVEEGGALRLRTKEDGGSNSRFMQNGSDPQATFREKAGRPACRQAGSTGGMPQMPRRRSASTGR